jgi:hypothetical protein
MSQITGQSGRFALNDSYLKFENWNIYANIVELNEPSQSYWSGSFEIQKSDFIKVFPLVGEQIGADFYGNENYSGKIIINQVHSNDPFIIDFIGTGRLKKSSLPQ